MFWSISVHAAVLAALCLYPPPLPELPPVSPPFARVALIAPPNTVAPAVRPRRPRRLRDVRQTPRIEPQTDGVPLPEAPRLEAEPGPTLSMPSEPPRLEAPRPNEPALTVAVPTSPRTKIAVRAAGFADSPIRMRAQDVRVNVGSFQGSPAALAEPSSANCKPDARPSGFANAFTAVADGKPGTAIGSSGFVSASFSEARGPKSATSPAGFNAVRGGRGEARPTQVEAAQEVTPVEILSKPKPRYTAEARERRIEGEVTLEARFGAEGRVEILRVLRGLGYGLDESAADAVREMKFRPATREGVAVDTVLGVSVAFRLAY